ncbi:MAG: tetratricopeptide repeat protein [Bdellovibrionota bacterium]
MKRLTHPLIMIAMATLVIWGVTLSYGFVWDDFPMIAANSSLHDLSIFVRGWSHDFWMLHDSPQPSGYWRPVPTMVHALIMQFTSAPWAFHLLNVFLHFLIACFFYRFLVHTRWIKWFWISIFFFLWHPINAETVSFNSAIPDLLSAVFGLAALMFWTDAHLSKTKKMSWTLICLALSFLSKESGVFFGLFMIGMEFLLHRDRIKNNAKVLISILGLIAIYALLHLGVTHGLGTREIWGGSLSIHIATVLKLFIYELFLIFVPIGSSPTRDFALGAWNQWQVWLGMLFLISSVAGLFMFRKSKPMVAFAIFFYLIFWFPVSNIIPAEGLIADRYLYLPSMAIAFAIGLLFNRCDRFPKIVGFVFVAWGVWAIDHSLVWKNSEKLWSHAIINSPRSSVAWNEWGNIQSSKREYQNAYDAYSRALQLRPQYRDASYNRTLVMYLVNDPETMGSLNDHLENFPNDAQAMDLYGSYYEAKKDFGSAEAFSKKAVAAEPLNWKYRYNLASVYLQRKKYNEAITELENAYVIFPNRFEILKNLAAAYCLDAKYEQCLKTYEEFIQRFPQQSEEVRMQMEQTKQLLELTRGS